MVQMLLRLVFTNVCSEQFLADVVRVRQLMM